MSDGVTLDDVADELYALAPGRFVEVRDARAKEVRSAGDRGLATQIGTLRRPTAAAWAVNLLVRGRADQVQQLLDLGEAMRSAQSGLEGDELRRLTVQRRQVVAALARQARADARAAGTPISEAVEQEVAATLLAALADPAAGDVVRTGRLTKALEYSGVGPVDAAAVAAASATGARPVAGTGRPAVPATASARPSAPSDDAGSADADAREKAEAAAREEARAQARRRAVEQARERLAAAQEEAEDLSGRAADAEREAGEATARHEAADAEVVRLEQALQDARAAAEAAKKDVAGAERAQRAARRHAEAARSAVEAARRELERLDG